MAPSSGKSRDAVRTVDLDAGLVEVLARQRDLQAKEREVAGHRWQNDGWVFTMPDGDRCHPQFLSKLLGRFSAQHGLRHTSATLM